MMIHEMCGVPRARFAGSGTRFAQANVVAGMSAVVRNARIMTAMIVQTLSKHRATLPCCLGSQGEHRLGRRATGDVFGDVLAHGGAVLETVT
jgi:hypothetical protein